MGNFLDAIEQAAKPYESYFISEKFKYANDEVIFFNEQFHYQNQQEKTNFEKYMTKVYNYSIAGINILIDLLGGCLGLSLSMSLRRYVPSLCGQISVQRCLVDVSMLLLGYTYFTKFGIASWMEETQDLRAKLLLSRNEQYIRFLTQQYQKYYPNLHINQEQFLRQRLNQEQYDTWKTDAFIDFEVLGKKNF